MQHYSRRSFVKRAAASAAGIGIMGAYSFSYSGNKSANDRIRVAVVGTNSRGSALASGFARTPGVEVAFICDVDDRAIAKGLNVVKDIGYSGEARGIKDFRNILDDKSVDAVVIAMPDHWHAPAAIMALQAGKHVYVEKPGSHNPHEGELVEKAAKKYGKVVQMGNQRRSWPIVREAFMELKSGIIGDPHFARTWYGANRQPIGFGKISDVPAGIDYELWQGPAPRRPFRDNLIHYNWHWFWHWGTGELLNNGTHFIDLARLGLGVEYPYKVSSHGGRYAYNDDWETPDTQITVFDFPENKTISWEGRSCNARPIEGLGAAVSFHSEQGTMVLSNNSYTFFDNSNKEIKKVTNEEVAIDLTGGGFNMDSGHIENFSEAIRTGKQPRSVYHDSNISVLACHLGNIAHRVGRTINCNPDDGKIINDPEAMRLWGRDYESGWKPTV
ncbi:MAG: Gfo/Idh/MocA family oxidoreductase [Bacteroidales bacterium]